MLAARIKIFDSIRIRGQFRSLTVLFLLFSLPSTALYGAEITVNTTADELLANTDCSLREAVISANSDLSFGGCTAGSGTDQILLSDGVYHIGDGQCDGVVTYPSQCGNLDLTSDLEIFGAPSGGSIISGNGTARELGGLFWIHVGDNQAAPNMLCQPGVTVSLTDLTLLNGVARHGGAIYLGDPVNNLEEHDLEHSYTHHLILQKVTVSGNRTTSGGFGGGIYSEGILDVKESRIPPERSSRRLWWRSFCYKSVV